MNARVQLHFLALQPNPLPDNPAVFVSYLFRGAAIGIIRLIGGFREPCRGIPSLTCCLNFDFMPDGFQVDDLGFVRYLAAGDEEGGHVVAMQWLGI